MRIDAVQRFLDQRWKKIKGRQDLRALGSLSVAWGKR